MTPTQAGPPNALQMSSHSPHRTHERRRRSPKPSKRLLPLGTLFVLIALAGAAVMVARRASRSTRITAPPARFAEFAGPLDPHRLAAAEYRPAAAAAIPSSPTAVPPCDFYASPDGSGNGNTQDGPFRIANFWAVAGPGKTLCLLDGTYSGDGNMILPPQNLNGSEGAPITVRALNDGKVLIDGRGGQKPVQLLYNDWFVIDGIDACCSNASVVSLANAKNNVVRRVAAWDSADGNYEIFGAHATSYTLFEDVAGWGTARKVFQMSQGGDYTTIRRAWGRWERSTVVGPKLTYTLSYNNYHLTCENCIGTWSGQGMPQSYVLLDYYGQPWTGPGAGTYTNGDLDQPIGIFGVDGSDDKNVDARLLGSLAYLLPTDTYKPGQVVFMSGLDSVTIRDTVVYIAPGTNPTTKPFELAGLSSGQAQRLVAENLTAFGGASSFFAADWQNGNVWFGATVAGSYAPGESVFKTARGASLYYRYQNGSITDQPLWPWPMNKRIADALVKSGRAPVDVTATVQSFFGDVPLIGRTVVPVAPRRPTPHNPD